MLCSLIGVRDLLCVLGCLLTAAVCELFDARRLLFVVCVCLLFGVRCCQVFVICCVLCVVLLFVVCWLVLFGSCVVFAVCGMLFVVCWLLFGVACCVPLIVVWLRGG